MKCTLSSRNELRVLFFVLFILRKMEFGYFFLSLK